MSNGAICQLSKWGYLPIVSIVNLGVIAAIGSKHIAFAAIGSKPPSLREGEIDKEKQTLNTDRTHVRLTRPPGMVAEGVRVAPSLHTIARHPRPHTPETKKVVSVIVQ